MAFSIAELRVYNPRDFFGAVDYEGEHVTWDLLSLFGAPGSTFFGLCPDPTGDFLMQYPVPVALDAGTAQWTPNAGNQAAYSQAKDAVTGKLFLRCAPSTAAPAFDTTLHYVRPDDEGFSCQLYRAATAGGSLYLHLSAGREAGTPGLRLAIEAGRPIRLQVSTDDDATWTDAATAPLGECESYLTSVGRYLTVDVLSECDPNWYPSADAPFPPPGQVCVTLNGTTVLTWTGDSLPGGAVRISGSAGQWSVLSYAQKLFVPQCFASLPAQERAAPYQGEPRTFVSGYQPYDQMTAVEVTAAPSAPPSPTGGMQVIAGSQATAILTITTPQDGLVLAADGNTYAGRTCFLSAGEATWPVIQVAANPAAPYVSYEPIYAVCEPHFDQGTRTVRRRAVCIFQSQDDSYAPGNVIPAARAGVLLMGDIADAQLTPVHHRLDGDCRTQRPAVAVGGLAKALRRGHRRPAPKRRTTIKRPACTCPPFDYQAHYLPVRRLHHKIGITDEWMTSFPDVDEDGLLPDGSQFQGLLSRWRHGPGTLVAARPGRFRERVPRESAGSGRRRGSVERPDPADDPRRCARRQGHLRSIAGGPRVGVPDAGAKRWRSLGYSPSETTP